MDTNDYINKYIQLEKAVRAAYNLRKRDSISYFI